jgi:exodeoxyribonuclease V gamma subunit
VLQLDSLVRFVEHPTKSFLRERLGVYVGDGYNEVDDSLPIELDGLGKWSVGDRVLAARLAGVPAREASLAERARGLLPPGVLGDAVLDDVLPTVESLAAAVAALPCSASSPQSMQVNVTLPDGRVLVGTVPGVRDGTIVRCIYSSLAAKHRISAWVRFLALTAAHPDRSIAALTIGRSRLRSGGHRLICVSGLDPLSEEPEARLRGAVDQLRALVDLYDRGMAEPLPIYCDTSAAWAESRRKGGDPRESARAVWTTGRMFSAEDQEPEHLLVLGAKVPFESLLGARPAPDESGPEWEDSEDTRLGRLALRLWTASLQHEWRRDL